MNFRLGMTILVGRRSQLYFPLNRKLTGGFNLSTRSGPPGFRSGDMGNSISAVPAGLGGGLIWAAWKMDDELFVPSSARVCSSCHLQCYFFTSSQTYVKRPVLTGGN